MTTKESLHWLKLGSTFEAHLTKHALVAFLDALPEVPYPCILTTAQRIQGDGEEGTLLTFKTSLEAEQFDAVCALLTAICSLRPINPKENAAS